MNANARGMNLNRPKTNELGKAMRKLRVDEDERLLDMAKRLGKSTAFVSAVETGRKAPPANFEEEVVEEYGLSDEYAATMRRAADLSRKAFVLEPSSSLGRDTAGLLARKIKTLSDEELTQIREILGGERGKARERD